VYRFRHFGTEGDADSGLHYTCCRSPRKHSPALSRLNAEKIDTSPPHSPTIWNASRKTLQRDGGGLHLSRLVI
ncbi:MAG: hypothetical protein E7K64_09575, partial [Clostridia bacterium]|nr:hypothetical protein [Clostridia bacterium]